MSSEILCREVLCCGGSYVRRSYFIASNSSTWARLQFCNISNEVVGKNFGKEILWYKKTFIKTFSGDFFSRNFKGEAGKNARNLDKLPRRLKSKNKHPNFNLRVLKT